MMVFINPQHSLPPARRLPAGNTSSPSPARSGPLFASNERSEKYAWANGIRNDALEETGYYHSSASRIAHLQEQKIALAAQSIILKLSRNPSLLQYLNNAIQQMERLHAGKKQTAIPLSLPGQAVFTPTRDKIWLDKISDRLYCLEYRSPKPSQTVGRIRLPFTLQGDTLAFPDEDPMAPGQHRMCLLPPLDASGRGTFVEIFLSPPPGQMPMARPGDVAQVSLDSPIRVLEDTEDLLYEFIRDFLNRF
jgi:hypothetical protein